MKMTNKLQLSRHEQILNYLKALPKIHEKVCQNCTKGKETNMTWGESDNRKLVPVLDFNIKLLENKAGDSSFYKCHQASLDCTCSKNISCAGNEQYCAEISCDNSSLCKCTVKKAIKEVSTERDGKSMIAPHIYSYFICLYRPVPNINYKKVYS